MESVICEWCGCNVGEGEPGCEVCDPIPALTEEEKREFQLRALAFCRAQHPCDCECDQGCPQYYGGYGYMEG